MKNLCKFFLLYTFIFTNNTSKAQYIVDNEPWCPPGATWVYRSFSQSSALYYKFQYEKDTILFSTTVKLLSVYEIHYIGFGENVTRLYNKVGQEYLYESNDSIFWYDQVNNDFSFMYKFNAQIGDFFIIENSRASCQQDASYPLSDTVFVISSYPDTSSNRIFNCNQTSYDRKFGVGAIISNIGSYNNPFPEINRMECNSSMAEYGEFYVWLICYSDSIRGNIQFEPDPYDNCNPLSTNIKDILNDNRSNYILFPNPSNDCIRIMNSKKLPIKKIEIYSSDGSFIFVGNNINQNSAIDISKYCNGLYFIKITDNENFISVLKFLKQ